MKIILLALAVLSPAIASAQVDDEWPMLYQSNANNLVQVTRTASQKLGFHGVTPIVMRTNANQTALIDSTGGDVTGVTLAATAGVSTISIPIQLASMTTSAADLVSEYVPGYKFKILATSFVTTTLGTGSGATQTLNLEIGTTDVTGGVVNPTLTSTNTLGKLTAGSSVSGANTGSATDTISVEVAAAGTVFTGGSGVLLIRIQNMDVADNMAKMTELTNELRTSLVTLGLITGS